ncbi:MAG: DUF1554 domain-containing protein [Myxococcales bacterium]
MADAGGLAGLNGTGGGPGGGPGGQGGLVGGVGGTAGSPMGGSGGTTARCGDGHQDTGEQCDQGTANSATAYGRDLCTTDCHIAPFCGDGVINGAERCDAAGSGATTLGSCNPECSGFYEKKFIKQTRDSYKTNLGGIAGADAICVTEFGSGWKALLVGGSRRATVTPFAADGQQDWVIKKYTHYYNASDQLLWRTDTIPLLGVRDGMRMNLYALAYQSTTYPWSGFAADWTTLDDIPAMLQGTCQGWTFNGTGGTGDDGHATFCDSDLRPLASELCGSSSFILCVQQ